MHPSTRRTLTWAPRVLTILLALFISVFAADAFEGQPDLAHKLVALAMHLIPTALVVVLLVVAWRFEWVGAVAFIALALLYTLRSLAHPQWILFIAGPAYLVGLLFAVSALVRKERPVTTRRTS